MGLGAGFGAGEPGMNYYEELGLESSASPEEIRRAYRKLAQVLHPDQHQDEAMRRVCERQLARLNGIADILEDPARREEYDLRLQEEGRIVPEGPTRLELVWEFISSQSMETWVWVGAAVVGVALMAFLFRWNAVSPGETPYRPAGGAEEAKVEAQGAPAAAAGRPAWNKLVWPPMPRRAPAPSVLDGQPYSVPAPLEASAPSPSMTPAPAPAVPEPAPPQAVQDVPQPQPEPPPRAPVAPPAKREEALPAKQAPPSAPVAPPARREEALPAKQAPLSAPVTPPAKREEATPTPAPAPKPAPRLERSYFAGRWLFSKDVAERNRALYPPEMIELAIAEENGTLRGTYRSRYRIVDRPISPDVNFEFAGPGGKGEAVEMGWRGSGGAEGRVRLRPITQVSMEVNWWATRMGALGLVSGTAVLIRGDQR
jgi:hypothetical protein